MANRRSPSTSLPLFTDEADPALDDEDNSPDDPKYFEDPSDHLLAESIKPHSNDKHEIVRQYVDICQHVRGKWRGVGCAATYMDLYCGPGRACDSNGTHFRDASPLIAWEIAKAPSRGAAHPFTAMIVSDKAHHLVEALHTRLATRGAPVIPFKGEAAAKVDDVVAQLGRGYHFALLDPYGIKQLPFTVIEKLARVSRLDMLIHVSASGLKRNLDLNVRGLHSNFDTFAPNWRSVYDPAANSSANVRAIFEHWGKCITALGKMPRGTEAITANGRTLYWLVLVSGHPRAGEFWNEITKLRAQRPLLLT